MSLNAHLQTHSDGNITVYLKGALDYENNEPLKKELDTIINQYPTSDITIDMHSVDFVGSSGINVFVDTLKILNEKKKQIKLANVKTEFLKVFKLYNLDVMDLLIQEFDNDETENLNTNFGNRSNTFQN